ncbi:nitroreductase family protein, partial [Klebsiella variicola]|nr:nitroreductase family protein [Klebsiella variicola]
DTQFHEQLPKLFPHADARSWYAGDQAKINAAALMNGSLQGGYLVLAARALGLDCGPMAGFDADKVNETFFPDGQWKVNFIMNI